MKKNSPKHKIRKVCSLLVAEYGNIITPSSRPPIETLVRAILSQNTNDVNMDRAFSNLKNTFGTWEDVLNCPLEQLGEVIHSSGFYRLKAKRIKSSLREIEHRVGSLDLSLLQDMPLDDAMNWLTSLDGMGPKSAAIVLLFSFGRPTIPVDTHVWRVTKRLGIIPINTTREKAQTLLEKIVIGDCIYSLNHNLVKHGREVCKARNPLCEICILKENCDYYAKQ